jgi:HD superfamily phosphohydrolase
MEFRGMQAFAIDALQTPELQRLRRIRQLGLARLVFPGAEHSRFVHALGAAHLAGRFAEALVEDSRDHLPHSLQPDETIVRDLVLAALCHDLGHGPLSHTWEQNVIGDFETDAELREEWRVALGLGAEPWLAEIRQWHELVTQALILTKGTLHDLLEHVEAGTSERVAAILGGRFYLRHLTRLVQSDVDVDRCDFVLRDAYQTGVAYGRYDLDWLVSTVTVGVDTATDTPVIGFDLAKAPRVVEQLLIARRALYDNVYHHRAVRSAEGMVGKLLALASRTLRDEPNEIEEAIGSNAALEAAIAGKPLSAAELLELDDDALWAFVRRLEQSAKNTAVRKLAGRIVNRELLKPVPISPRRLESLITSDQERMWERVDAVLKRHDYTEPGFFRFVDSAAFNFFHTREDEGSWFVDTRSLDREATPIIEHETFLHHRSEQRRVQRTLFVPREAVADVKRALDPEG